MANFNLATKQLADTTFLHLCDPADDSPLYATDDKTGEVDETKPAGITLYGRTSKQYRQWLSKTLTRNQKEADMNRGKIKAKPLEVTLKENAQFLASVSISCKNLDLDGVEIDNEAMFIQLYSDPRFDWIGKQVSEALNDDKNFLEQ